MGSVSVRNVMKQGKLEDFELKVSGVRPTNCAENEDDDQRRDVEGGVVSSLSTFRSAGGRGVGFAILLLPAQQFGAEEVGWYVGPRQAWGEFFVRIAMC